MDISKISNIIPTIDLSNVNKRAKLDTGKECNYSCSFCYYINQLDEVDSFETIKQRIDYLAMTGITEIDLSGGESSIHKNFIEIIEYCVSKGLRVSMLSNGSTFHDFEYISKAYDAGLKEILFSVQGFEHEHDSVVNSKGAFEKIIQSIHNAKKLGIVVRINTVITSKLKHIHELTELYKTLKPEQINLLTLNNFADAKMMFSYEKSSKIVKGIIDELDGIVPEINVRYTPYCYMKGYEKHVVNTLQHIYDQRDWNIVAYSAHERKLPHDEVLSNVDFYKEMVQTRRDKYYKKDPKCLKCSHMMICDGVEKNARNYLLEPYNGVKIKNINYYGYNNVKI